MKKGNRDEEEGPDEKVPDSKWFRHNSPVTQVILISLVCFCCSGMFNAISGLGGSGQENDQASNHANTALYATFSVFGIFAGGVYNILGPRRTIFAGCCTYALYADSFLYYNHDHGETFPVIAGGILGVGAALFWAGQGSIITSYPTEDKKGRYISLFWVIYNLGGVVGGFIPFILNYHSKAASVTDGTYIAFMCFMVSGTFVSLAFLPPNKVVRNDGSKPTLRKYSNVSTEGMEVLKLFFNWKMMLLFPAAWASKFFYTYEFNNVNGKIFTVRTRGLNNVSFWGAQMLGSVAIGYVLDFSFQNRKKRGFLGVAIVTILGTAIWGGGLANQLRYSRDKPLQEIDFKDSGSAFAGPFVLYFSYGLLDSMFQTLCYWIIGALADDSHTLSRYNGLFKAVQSAGTAVGWATDRQSVSLLEELIINWSLVTISYPFLIILIVLAVDDVPERGSTGVHRLQMKGRASGFKVAVLEAWGGIGQPLPMFMKMNPLVSVLCHLYDVVNTLGVTADISHMDTTAIVRGFVGKEQLEAALVGMDLVIIPAGIPRKLGMTRGDLFNINAGIVRTLCNGVTK